jgi:hypothetical protein
LAANRLLAPVEDFCEGVAMTLLTFSPVWLMANGGTGLQVMTAAQKAAQFQAPVSRKRINHWK